MATNTSHSWKDILTAEGIPINCGLVFHLQNRNINEIFHDGIRISISKINKRSLVELVDAYRVQILGGHGNAFDYDDIYRNGPHNELTSIAINFYDGAPTGRRASHISKQFFDRRDRAAHLNTDLDMGFSIED